jgi:2-polyprenyl-3-methyl-5-hydroxy-6-metoxy-1,4-benzoquinol methylase
MIYKIKKNFVDSRDEYFVKKCKGKRVLHIGACDSPYTIKKSEEGLLLHEKINKVADKVIGIDINKEAIFLMESLGFNDIIYFDLNKLVDMKARFDIIIFGETIEHVMNLEITLQNLKNVMGSKTELLISTPNAFFVDNFRSALKYQETNHPDHKLIFSYQTIKNLLEANNFKVNEMLFTFLNRSDNTFRKKIMKNIVKKYFNVIAETLVISCSYVKK